jgi:peptidyl-prolyl cis-trans isomerase SurA
MKKVLLLCAVVFSGYMNAQQQTLFSIDDEQISADEFKAVYLKNRDIGKDIDPKTPREYLDLYINFKLKVREARDMGMDTMPSFKREFNNYRNQLAQPYLEDRSVDSLLLQEAYSRMLLEVNASHIMIDLPANALPADTLAAYKKIMNLRAQVLKGAISFEDQARAHSTDPGSKDNGGNLGYFSVFDMVYPFENAAYETPVGEISMPVRTQFGYHIVKVIDRRPNSGTVQVKHIFLISNEKTDEEKAESASKRIQEIYVRLRQGEDFDQLARQFSDDKNTSDKGGLLSPFGINKMMPEFEKQSFALKTKGDISEPFKTSIGWHIVKLVDRQPVASFEDSKMMLEQQISRDSRSAKSREVFIANLKKEYKYTEQPKRLKEIGKVVTADFFEGKWDANLAAKYKKTLFTLDGIDYNQQAFVAFLDLSQKRAPKSASAEQAVYGLYQTYVDQTVMEYENGRLEAKYPEFRMLVNEYRDGILLFDLTQEKVWNKASKDSVGLHSYYELNQNNYMWPERVKANLFSCESEKIAKKVEKMVVKGSSISEVEAKFNQESQLVVVAESGTFSRGKNQGVDRAEWVTGKTSTVFVNNRFIVVQINEVLPVQPKQLDEARGLIISDYQRQLEINWIESLKARYKVTINEDVFRSLESELN